MKCRCKKNLDIPYNLNGNFLEFLKGNDYNYITEIHKESEILLYKVDIEGFNLPMVENKFYIYFSDIEQIREEKLNIILS